MIVLIADSMSQDGIDALAAFSKVVCQPDLKDDALLEAITEHNPDVLVVRSTKVRAEHLDAARALSLVVRAGAGTNTIAVDHASKRGIYVSNCPGKNSIAVAEIAFAHILSLDRFLADAAQDLQAGQWKKKKYSKAKGIYGSTLGLLGLGQIGREMIKRAHAFGLHVVAWSRSLTPEKAEALGVEYAATPTVVAQKSDILSVHVAMNDDTRHLVNRELLEAMPRNALFVNTSRGGVVDETALEWAVRERGLRVGLDVFENEPSGGMAEMEPGIFALAGIQGTHHIGASTKQAQDAVASEAVRIIKAYADSGNAPNCINLAKVTPATHLLVVRHEDRVGVLASILSALKGDGINVEEMKNIVFSGGVAACARIQITQEPSTDLINAIKDLDHVLSVQLKDLD